MQMIYSRLSTQPDWSHYYNLIGHTTTTWLVILLQL